MNKKNVIVGLLLIGGSLIAQVGNDEYNDLVNKGRSLYNEKKFKEAALSHSCL